MTLLTLCVFRKKRRTQTEQVQSGTAVNGQGAQLSSKLLLISGLDTSGCSDLTPNSLPFRESSSSCLNVASRFYSFALNLYWIPYLSVDSA